MGISDRQRDGGDERDDCDQAGDDGEEKRADFDDDGDKIDVRDFGDHDVDVAVLVMTRGM